ncbi:ABC transporter ATP-binding protein [Nocardioides panaciterrulae]|uniref:Putative ABC transport system ATP-binding protein n=1 Tax=Nocardioides panaciterrulae TaxID=661492 RepID=A0A7Y9E5H1_9ACTN|nr:ATP-binding cassette domain-containing protein [Nocardioides panaciterrulae]NYD41505.1 putative ABC transport system ATP-binding protein [Nocardioides panaciterrulae]
MSLVAAHDLRLSYGDTPALDGCSLSVEAGERVAMMGPSGSGKSTLLHCLAGVLRPDAGTVMFDGVDVVPLSESRRSRLRLERMGVVFQFGDLVPELSLAENVMLPAQLLGMSSARARSRALALLDELGVADVAHRRAGTVSGGQAQRAAVARAIVHEPAVVYADEPTGSLDTVNAELVLDALVDLTGRSGAALVVVTHDHQVAAHLDRLVTMRDGRVTQPAGVGA